MSNDIRLTRLKLEAIEIDSKFNEETRKIFTEWKLDESQLNEGLLDTIKDKFAKMLGMAKDNPEAVKAKVDNMEAQLRAQGKDELVDKTNSFMERFGRNFPSNAGESMIVMMALKGVIFGLWTAATVGVGAGAVVFGVLTSPMALQALYALAKTIMGGGYKEPEQANIK